MIGDCNCDCDSYSDRDSDSDFDSDYDYDYDYDYVEQHQWCKFLALSCPGAIFPDYYKYHYYYVPSKVKMSNYSVTRNELVFTLSCYCISLLIRK